MEYANTKVFRLIPDQKINERKVDAEVKKYNATGELNTIIVNNDYIVLESPESYIAGRKLGLPYLASARVKSERSVSSKFPSAILLEITNRCNLLCKMCPRNQLTREEKDMDFLTFKKIIDEISYFNLEGLWLYNLGESMLHPRFFDMLAYVNKYPRIHPLWLSTNGIILNEQNTENLLHSNLDFLNVSLNAMDQETYKKISPRSNYELVTANLEHFLKRKEQLNLRKPFLRVQMVDQPEVHDQIPHFLKEWGSKADIININQLERFDGQEGIPTNKESLTTQINNFEPCRRIDRGFLYIYSNNKVNLCGVDFNCINSIGDVSDTSIWQIWNGEPCKTLYESIKHQKFENIPICYNCNDRGLT